MLSQNNPGNIRPNSAYRWQGETGSNNGFVVFDTMENGIRALATNMLTYQSKYGTKTVKQAITRWAPPEDHNDTAGYIAFVDGVLKCGPNDEFDFRNVDFLYWIVVAIGEEENGHDAFLHGVTDTQIDEGIEMALT